MVLPWSALGVFLPAKIVDEPCFFLVAGLARFLVLSRWLTLGPCRLPRCTLLALRRLPRRTVGVFAVVCLIPLLLCVLLLVFPLLCVLLVSTGLRSVLAVGPLGWLLLFADGDLSVYELGNETRATVARTVVSTSTLSSRGMWWLLAMTDLAVVISSGIRRSGVVVVRLRSKHPQV